MLPKRWILHYNPYKPIFSKVTNMLETLLYIIQPELHEFLLIPVSVKVTNMLEMKSYQFVGSYLLLYQRFY